MGIIEDYEFGRLVVDGRTYLADVLIMPDGVHANWWREEGHELSVADLFDLIQGTETPDVLVVGTGAQGRMSVLPETREWLRGQRISLEEVPTPQACQLYNHLVGQGRRVAAALHLTC